MLVLASVFYNKTIGEIAALDQFKEFAKKHNDVSIVLYDNNPSALSTRKVEYDKENNATVIASGKNVGLSRANNRILDFCLKKFGADCWIMYSDDDTVFPVEYLEAIYEAVNDPETIKKKINVFSAFVVAGGEPMSPVYEFHPYNRDYVMEPGVYDDICVINSGMCINAAVLEKVSGFDYDLFLDMVDYKLMYDLKKAGLCKVQILPFKIEQEFSGRDSSDKKAKVKRYAIYSHDFRTYAKKTKMKTGTTYFELMKRRTAITFDK